jgi:hypothetical protein
MVGGLGTLAMLLPVWVHPSAFCLPVALVCLCGALILNTTGADWATAFARQRAVCVRSSNIAPFSASLIAPMLTTANGAESP